MKRYKPLHIRCLIAAAVAARSPEEKVRRNAIAYLILSIKTEP